MGALKRTGPPVLSRDPGHKLSQVSRVKNRRRGSQRSTDFERKGIERHGACHCDPNEKDTEESGIEIRSQKLFAHSGVVCLGDGHSADNARPLQWNLQVVLWRKDACCPAPKTWEKEAGDVEIPSSQRKWRREDNGAAAGCRQPEHRVTSLRLGSQKRSATLQEREREEWAEKAACPEIGHLQSPEHLTAGLHR